MADSVGGESPTAAQTNGHQANENGPQWGSDVVSDVISKLDIKYVAFVPGSASRGFHDSVVNYKGNVGPELLLCLHEEAAVAIAHGYAKVNEERTRRRPMAALVDSNVGLMHASMAVYNAFCDRVPMLILGFNGSVDGAKRRPWIDWVHTSADVGALVRPYVKFDDCPVSLHSTVESVLECHYRTVTEPCAPTYVRIDVGPLEEKVEPEDWEQYLKSLKTPGPASNLQAGPDTVRRVQKLLSEAKKVAFLFGRTNQSTQSWESRQRLIRFCGSIAIGDLKQPCAFPLGRGWSHHPPSLHNDPETMRVLTEADLIVSFNWTDLAGTIKTAFSKPGRTRPHIVHVSLDHLLHNGWSNDRFGFMPGDDHIQSDPDTFVESLLSVDGGVEYSENTYITENRMRAIPLEQLTAEHITMRRLARAVDRTINPSEICMIRIPLTWDGSDLRTEHPLAFLGMDGGAGVGSGPGQAVGAALALRDHHPGLLPLAILGDGDFFMGAPALWTAARYRIPLLVIVANNASFYNDESHQEKVARTRGRPVENKHIGVKIDDPEPDVGKMAESMGLKTVGGQVRLAADLDAKLAHAVKEVKSGDSVVLDVRVVME